MAPLEEVRRRLEEREHLLSPFAAKSFQSRGRQRPEAPCPLRNEFQRDRDRILHSKAFRRLKHKTQVFVAPQGDHFVTRLTHTLEVAQIARTIARALNLNEDLAEAIALAHDIGHPPFGHAGEAALDELVPGGFRHAEQGLRVVEQLENGGQGLNLTWEVRDGIRFSSKPRHDILGEGEGMPSTLEGQVVKLADAVAYLNHDVADAIRAGLITEDDLPPIVQEVLGRTPSQRIDTMVRDIVAASWAATGELGLHVQPRILMGPKVHTAANALRDFLFERVYLWEGRRQEAEQAKAIVRALYLYYLEHPDEIKSDYVVPDDPPWRKAADYVSGMTDHFALQMARRLGLTPLSSLEPLC
ncbi:MAG: deoxyguanosinetriphosphate triphosphohydrolase [Dehalococcoidia bacterium]|jgi:dGTPase|nr:deoxyguanosinetriphosphate triphosphohydrolase [Dehalococcoidia bacterium]